MVYASPNTADVRNMLSLILLTDIDIFSGLDLDLRRVVASTCEMEVCTGAKTHAATH